MKKVLAFLVFLSYMNISMLDTIAANDDDDSGQVFPVTGITACCLSQPVLILQDKKPQERNIRQFAEYRPGKIRAVSIDIITPPPETPHIA